MEGPGVRPKQVWASEINPNDSHITLGKPCDFSVFVSLAVKKMCLSDEAFILNKVMYVNADSSLWHIVVLRASMIDL